MGCGLKFKENDVIAHLLSNDFVDQNPIKEVEFSAWTDFDNLYSTGPKNQTKSKNPSKSQNCNRVSFGYKPSNKINLYVFRHYEDAENYVIQYRNENMIVPCLADSQDLLNVTEILSKAAKVRSNSIIKEAVRRDTADPPPTETIVKKVDSAEKSLLHHIRFWKNQNIVQPVLTGDSSDGRPLEAPYAVSLPPPNRCRYRIARSSIPNKRNLDIIIPQGTAYDILSEESRLNGGGDIDKLGFKINQRMQSIDAISFPISHIAPQRENTRIQRLSKEGGTLEFARLLDEKLRQLYEQRGLFQSPDEKQRLRIDNKNLKTSRLKSATNVNPTLRDLSVNGRSTGLTKVSIPMTTEFQPKYFMPCLPQMPAFGMHNFPKFINNNNSIDFAIYNKGFQGNTDEE